jgi:hypothetical protein
MVIAITRENIEHHPAVYLFCIREGEPKLNGTFAFTPILNPSPHAKEPFIRTINYVSYPISQVYPDKCAININNFNPKRHLLNYISYHCSQVEPDN